MQQHLVVFMFEYKLDIFWPNFCHTNATVPKHFLHLSTLVYTRSMSCLFLLLHVRWLETTFKKIIYKTRVYYTKSRTECTSLCICSVDTYEETVDSTTHGIICHTIRNSHSQRPDRSTTKTFSKCRLDEKSIRMITSDNCSTKRQP